MLEKERRKVMASKPIPYLLRYIIELADLTVTCELHLQHLSLCIVPCGSDHRISQYVPSHCLLFSLSVSAFVIPDRNVLYYNAFSYIFSLKEFPLYTFTLRFCPTHYDNRRLFYFSLRFTLMQVLAYFLNTCAVSHALCAGLRITFFLLSADHTIFSFDPV